MEILRYLTEAGKDVVGDWLAGLRDTRTRAKIAARIARLAAGNFGDCKSLGRGLYEFRIDWGPGYRIYYAMIGQRCLLLLCGGDKATQAKDIRKARDFWTEYGREK